MNSQSQQLFNIEIALSRTTQYWQARPLSTEIKFDFTIHGQGNTREEAIGDLTRKMQRVPIIIRKIYMSKDSNTTAYCGLNGIDWEDLL